MSRGAFAGAAVGAIVGLLVLGSWLYWRGEGSPGTPAEFRERVAETGLDVEWERNGPNGGDGTLTTSCDERPVTVQLIDGALYLVDGTDDVVGGTLRRLTPDRVDDLTECADG